MTPPEQEHLDAISASLIRLQKRQDELESRLRRIESQGALHPVAPPEIPIISEAPPPILQGVIEHAAPPPLPQFELPPAVSESGPPRLVQGFTESAPGGLSETRLSETGMSETGVSETHIGLNWVNRIAVVTLIFAAAFFFKYAVDSNWIGPAMRVALGVAAAVIALFFGDRMWRRGHTIFAQGLMGLGVALLYLSFYASFALYALLPQSAAFTLMALTTVAAGLVGLQYEAQAIAILGLLGGYLTPVLLSTGEDHPWFLFSYTFVLNCGGLALKRVRRWPLTEYLSLIATVLLYAGWYAAWFTGGTRAVAVTFAVLFYAQFATAESRAIVSIAQLLAAIATVAILDTRPYRLGLSLIFATGGLAVAEFRRWKETPPWTLFCFWLPYGFWLASARGSADYAFSAGTTFGLLSIGFALFFLWVLWWAILCRRVLRSSDLAMFVVNAAAYFAASYHLLNPGYHDEMGYFAVALALVHMGAAKLLSKHESHEPSVLAIAITLSFLTLAIPIQFAGFRITIAWALEGSALAWLAARYKTERLNVASWLIFGLVLLRLFGVDAWIDSGAFGIRFVTFTVSAVGLWLAARFAKFDLPAAVPYVAGHFVMLWNLGMEVIGWAERSQAADLGSIETTAISILMALYALMLVVLGVATRTAINRVLGLGLIGVVVAKLYLSDIWQLSRIFRITAFLALGVLLLLVSYLYSRFKPVIERLWKDDGVARPPP
jgi:uncharacterized membrane protein